MATLVDHISDGRPVQLTEGPDAICAGLDDLAVRDVTPVPGPLDAPLVLTADKLASLRSACAANTIRAACAKCPWHDFCDEIVAEDYADTKLWAVAE